MKPIKKKYHSKDLNIAYNDGYAQAVRDIKKGFKKSNVIIRPNKITFLNKMYNVKKSI